MTSKQVTITLSPKTLETIENRIDSMSGESRSQRIDKDLQIYWAVINHGLNEAKRKLSKKQVSLILDAMNGTACFFLGHPIGLWANGGLTQEVNDAMELNGADKKWEVDREDTIKAVNSLSDCAVFAILDFVEMFWRDTNQQLEEYVKGFQGVEAIKRSKD